MLPYTGKATALVALGKIGEAEQLLEHALSVAQGSNSIGYQAELSTQLALLAKKAGNTRRAAQRFADAIRLGTQVEGWRPVALSYFELSKIQENSGELVAAERSARQSVAACRRLSDRFFLPRYLAHQGDIEIKRGRIREAKATYAEAEDIINGILVNVNSPWTKSSLIAAMNDVFTGNLRLEFRVGRNARRVFHVVEEARGRPVADLLRARRNTKPAVSAELTNTERKIAALQIQLQRTSGRRERQRILDQLYEAEQEMGPLTASANQWMRVARRPVELEHVQRSLGPGERILEYVLDNPSSYCIVISRSGTQIRTLRSRSEIEQTVMPLLKSLRAADDPTLARQVYDAVFKPVEQDVAASGRLVVVPDGVLHQLPFEVLRDSKGRQVLQGYTVSYAPSASVLALLRGRQGGRNARLPLLAVSAGPQNAPTARPGSSPFGTVVRGLYDVEAGDLPPLAAANGEVRDVATILGPGSIVLTEASEADVKAQPLQNFSVLHFAVHGLTSTKFSERSTLVLRSDESRHEDGLLQAREIMDFALNADLVTLSACGSGSGQISGQEGVSSLARPFLVAGARSVVANLWNANDDVSRSLMKAFYTHLAAGEDEGSALRQAKLDMIKAFGSHATPFLWAGFVVMGDSAARISVGP